MPNINTIIAYEQGELSYEDTVQMFQELIDSGEAWTLQEHYGRTAAALINEGECSRPAKDYSLPR